MSRVHQLYTVIYLALVDIVVYVVALLPPLAGLHWLWSAGFARQLAVLALSILLIAPSTLLALALLRPLAGRVRTGRFPLQSREANAWLRHRALASTLQRTIVGRLLAGNTLFMPVVYRVLGARVGGQVSLGVHATIADPTLTTIERGVRIGDGAYVTAHLIDGPQLTLAPVVMRADATIGAHALVSPGADVGPHAIVAAGAVVAKNTRIDEGQIWGGVPARLISRGGADSRPASSSSDATAGVPE